MKNQVNNLLLFLIILFMSCNYTHKEYYDNSKLKLKLKLKNGKRNGRCLSYYRSGVLKSKTFWEDDLLNGEAIYYYESGEKKMCCEWVNNNRHGSIYYYYKNKKLWKKGTYYKDKPIGNFLYYRKDGSIEAERDYIFLHGLDSTYLNEVIFFNGYNDTIYEKSHFFNITRIDSTGLDKDTIFFDIHLASPYLNGEMEVVIGDFDKYFKIRDTISLDTLEGVNYHVKIDIVPSLFKNNYLRGYISDIVCFDKGEKLLFRERRSYFEIEISPQMAVE